MGLFSKVESHLDGCSEGYRMSWQWARGVASFSEMREYVAALEATPDPAPLPPSSWDYVCDIENPDPFRVDFSKGVLCFFAEVVFALQWEGAGPSSIRMEALIDRDMDEEQEIDPPGSSGEVEVVQLRAGSRR